MLIPTTDESIYRGIIQYTTSDIGVTIQELAEQMEIIRKGYYEVITKDEFYETLQIAVFKLLKYGVLYMIHGHIYQHENMVRPGDVIIDTLREMHCDTL